MFTKENVINASFIDNERKQIEVLYRNEETKTNHSHVIEYDTKHPHCQEILNIFSLDEIHAATHNKIVEQKKAFDNIAMKVARKSGMIFDEKSIDTKFYPSLVKAIFEDKENEDHLFALKLALFEVKKIRDSNDDEIKKKLRQSKTKMEVLKIAMEMMDD